MAGKRRRDASTEEDKPVDTTHPSRKRRVEYTETDAKLASFYNDLSDDVKSVRLRAAAELIRSLSDAEPERLDKALTRLIRGLCSSRKAARSGFSVALTEVLRLTPKHPGATSGGFDLTLPSLVKRILNATTPDVRSNSQERRDYLLGRCFGIKSLIQSQLLFNKDVPIAQWEEVLDLIFQLASETIWLRRECGMTLYETLSSLHQIENIDLRYVNLLINKLHDYKLTKTPEGLAIWLTVSSLFPEASLPKGVWNHNDPLSGKERVAVAKALRDNSTEDESAPSKTSGAAQTSPSFAWQVVLNQLYERNKPNKKTQDKPSEFDKFWIESVDNGLFSSSASTERKALGMQVVILGIISAPAELLASVFSPNVMRCIINQRGDAGRYLHEAAKAPLLQAVVRGKADQDAIPFLLEAFLSERGSVDFDKLTKTKTVEELVKRVKGESADKCLRIVQNLVLHPCTEDWQQADNRRRMLSDMLLHMVRNSQPEETIEANKKEAQTSLPCLVILLGMVDFAYGGPSAGKFKASPPLSDATQEAFQSRLMSCLSHVMSTRMDREFQVPETVVSAVRIADKTSTSGLSTKADKKVIKVVEKAHETITELHHMEQKKKEKSKPALRAFKALFALSVLQAYNGEADVIGVLEDLDMAYQSWQKSTDSSIMLVEILLSFISKPSAVYRKLAQQVFGAFASQLNEDGLQSMLDILEKKESLSGQQELFDNADEVEGDEEDIEGEDDSDVEMLDGEDASDVEVVEADESDEEDGVAEEDDEASDDSEDEEGGEDAEFEKKLAEALRTSKAGADPKTGSESDDDSDMDDEQMMALDGHLTTIFKERSKISNKKQDNKDAKENIVNFKNRVLDLLLIFAKQEHANALTLDLVLPMIFLIRTTSSKQLSEKALNLLQQYFDACKKSKRFPEPDEADHALDLLKSVHSEMRANASKIHSNACSRSSLFIAKLLVNMDASHFSAVADMYTMLEKEWYCDPKSHIQASIFTEWTSWAIATRKRD